MKNKCLILVFACLCSVWGFAQSMPELARKIATVSADSPFSRIDFSRCKIRKNNLLYEDEATYAKVALHRYYDSQGSSQTLALIHASDGNTFTLSFYRYDVKSKQLHTLKPFFEPAGRADFMLPREGMGYWRMGASFLEDGTIVVDASPAMAIVDYYVYRWNGAHNRFDRYFHGNVPITVFLDDTYTEKEAQKYIGKEIRPWVQDFNLDKIKWVSSKSYHRKGVDFTAFYDSTNCILKAVYKSALDGMEQTVEYYFKDARLVFVYSQADCEIGRIEERFYLKDHHLIYYKGNAPGGTPEERYGIVIDHLSIM